MARASSVMSHYLIDGRYIQDRCPGIARYVFNLTCALAGAAPDRRFAVLIDPTAANTRFDAGVLSALPNVELRPCPVAVFSLSEQRLGLGGLLRGASVYHSPSYTMPLRTGMASVLTLFDATPFVIADEVRGSLRRLAVRSLYRLSARRARRVIAPSRSAARELQAALSLPDARLSIVPLGVGFPFRPATTSSVGAVRHRLGLPDSYVLYLGTNKPKKNLPRLVQAWARVPGPASLVIAGAWDDRYPEARRLAASLGQEHRILFRPNVPEADVPLLVAGAVAFVFPSLHEGFGLPPLEALACGTPVVCSGSSSLPEVVGEAALFFDPTRVDSMTDAIARMLDDRDLRARLRDRGLAVAAGFTWERAARGTLAVYEEAAR